MWCDWKAMVQDSTCLGTGIKADWDSKFFHLCRKPVQGLDAASDAFRAASVADAFQEVKPFADDLVDLLPHLLIVQLCFSIYIRVEKQVQENKKAGKNCQA